MNLQAHAQLNHYRATAEWLGVFMRPTFVAAALCTIARKTLRSNRARALGSGVI